MAVQSGIGVSRILIYAGAGYTGTILLNNGKLSELLRELQNWVGVKSGSQSDGDGDYSAVVAAQLNRLAKEIERLASDQRVVVLNEGNLTSMVVPAATVGALGYGYMWWKGWSFSDLMYVTRRNMANAVASLTQNLHRVTKALNDAKKHLTQRIENLDGKMDDQLELSREIKNDVCAVKVNLDGLGHELEALQELVYGLDGRMVSLEYKQDWAIEGIKYLCNAADGQKVEMPKILQEQPEVLGAPRATLLRFPDSKGLKYITDATSEGIGSPVSDLKGQDSGDNLNVQRRVFFRGAPLIKC